MTKELEGIKNEVVFWESLKKSMEDIISLAKDVTEEDVEEISIIEDELGLLKKKFENIERESLYQGEYDENDSILSISAGAGGVDAQDWAQMLLRMYLRYCEKNNYKTKIINETRGSEAGLKKVTVEVIGKFSFGNLKNEKGVHRLVRLSPFNAKNLRETSFAMVEVLPIVESAGEIEINEKDLRIDTFRASGAGGQHVNTTDSAVRITHIPSGLVSACQSERSQIQNKEQAMKLLRAKLFEMERERKEKEHKELKGEKKSVEWGNQIRSYVLHPYKMVKDHRTGFETSNAESVLDGDLEKFIEEKLKN